MKMHIMIGLPASGKSTLAAELMKQYGNTIRVNKDLIRTMLHFDTFSRGREAATHEVAQAIVRKAFELKKNVIIDDTNLNPKTKKGWVELAKELGFKIEYHRMETPVLECCERDRNREKRVGCHVIKKMAIERSDYLKGKEVIICDIDGTISDPSHRLMYAKGGTKDWKTFFGLMEGDLLREETVEKIITILEQNKDRDISIIFVSARPEEYREVTEKWLKDNLEKKYPILFKNIELLIMRENNDKREDTVVKSEIYDRYLSRVSIVALFDDRPRVIEMWREKGVENVIDVGAGVDF